MRSRRTGAVPVRQIQDPDPLADECSVEIANGQSTQILSALTGYALGLGAGCPQRTGEQCGGLAGAGFLVKCGSHPRRPDHRTTTAPDSGRTAGPPILAYRPLKWTAPHSDARERTSARMPTHHPGPLARDVDGPAPLPACRWPATRIAGLTSWRSYQALGSSSTTRGP